MAVFKCKMCGGTIEFEQGSTVGTCDSCGTVQTLPKASDDNITNLFNRANNLRLKSEFDRAEKLYEQIVASDDSEAEAHWGIVLCRYGIEYVEDPVTKKMVPTCHRTMVESIKADPDYIASIDYSDAAQQELYESEAREIDRLQKEILLVANREEPFDVFICYKETDSNGNKTQDSVIANDIYYQLTKEGLKVFYAAITLEDKLGQEYEPYIFAALNSAKVMLVVGTKQEYFDSVWVRNEWARFLKIMKNDREKIIIPCYRDFDAYELPDEFSHFQAQDMSKIGFINDLVRGIKKVVGADKSEAESEANVIIREATINTEPLLKRAFMFLEDGDWIAADAYCEKVLDADPECAQAYLAKLMCELKVNYRESLGKCGYIFNENKNYIKVLKFGSEELKEEVNDYLEQIKAEKYRIAVNKMNSASSEDDYLKTIALFRKIPDYNKSLEFISVCNEQIKRFNVIDELNKQIRTGLATKTTLINQTEAAQSKVEEINGLKAKRYVHLALFATAMVFGLLVYRLSSSGHEMWVLPGMFEFFLDLALLFGLARMKRAQKNNSPVKNDNKPIMFRAKKSNSMINKNNKLDIILVLGTIIPMGEVLYLNRILDKKRIPSKKAISEIADNITESKAKINSIDNLVEQAKTKINQLQSEIEASKGELING